MRNVNMPWESLLLGFIDEGSKVTGATGLQFIYRRVGEQQSMNDPSPVNQKLFGTDGRWGDRPDYQHHVRRYMTLYVRDGLVERVGRGLYRLTPAGEQRLKGWN